MDFVLWEACIVEGDQAYLLGLVKSDVRTGLDVQIEFVFAHARCQKLDGMFDNAARVPNLFDGYDFSFFGSKHDPPRFLFGVREERGMHETSLLALLEVVARDGDPDGAKIAFIDLVIFIVIYKDLAFDSNVRQHLQVVEHILLLFISECGHSLLLIIRDVTILQDGGRLSFSFLAVLDLLGGEVRQLKKRGVLDPHGLRHKLPELDAVHCCLQRVLVLADADHGIDKTAGNLEHVLQVFKKQRVLYRSALSKEVGMHQNVALHADRMVKLRLLHLALHKRHELGNFRLILGRFGHVALSEFRASRHDFGKRLDESVFVEGEMVPRVGVVHDVILPELGRIGVVRPNAERDDSDHDDEVHHQDEVAVSGVQKEVGQADADLERLLPVWIAEFSQFSRAVSSVSAS
mmetsp:Transcript_21949/g.62523  ORF Transcript_21949/g.62523 Transcript_21949/m.62523 type:complete len:405 (+) Transcript_21949:323-1537(+)